jgi:hypothetical protein
VVKKNEAQWVKNKNLKPYGAVTYLTLKTILESLIITKRHYTHVSFEYFFFKSTIESVELTCRFYIFNY